jgi:hypothetical protein
MQRVFTSTVVNAPIERVWKVVADFNGLPAWMAGMKTSVIEDGKAPDIVGAIRRLGMDGGGVLRERLEVLEPAERHICYSVLEGPLPVSNVRTTIRLRPITDQYATYAEWSSQFDTAPGQEAAGVEFLTRVFYAGFRQLKRYLNV